MKIDIFLIFALITLALKSTNCLPPPKTSPAAEPSSTRMFRGARPTTTETSPVAQPPSTETSPAIQPTSQIQNMTCPPGQKFYSCLRQCRTCIERGRCKYRDKNNRFIKSTYQDCEPRCFCNLGYYENSKGKCVQGRECPCTTAMPDYCDNRTNIIQV